MCCLNYNQTANSNKEFRVKTRLCCLDYNQTANSNKQSRVKTRVYCLDDKQTATRNLKTWCVVLTTIKHKQQQGI